tara:strand:- start:659 stop:1468 length:810 start_codon:yes stop_codon:yes gene_type:complete
MSMKSIKASPALSPTLSPALSPTVVQLLRLLRLLRFLRLLRVLRFLRLLRLHPDDPLAFGSLSQFTTHRSPPSLPLRRLSTLWRHFDRGGRAGLPTGLGFRFESDIGYLRLGWCRAVFRRIPPRPNPPPWPSAFVGSDFFSRHNPGRGLVVSGRVPVGLLWRLAMEVVSAWATFCGTRPDIRGRCEVGSTLIMLLTMHALPAHTQSLMLAAIFASGALLAAPSAETAAVFSEFVAAHAPGLCGDCALFGAVRAVAAGRPPGPLCRVSRM